MGPGPSIPALAWQGCGCPQEPAWDFVSANHFLNQRHFKKQSLFSFLFLSSFPLYLLVAFGKTYPKTHLELLTTCDLIPVLKSTLVSLSLSSAPAFYSDAHCPWPQPSGLGQKPRRSCWCGLGAPPISSQELILHFQEYFVKYRHY